MILHFPAMHPGYVSGPAPETGLFFDPGLDDEPRENSYRPEGLPLIPAKARKLMQDSMQFGQQFKNPGDMVVQAMFQEAEDTEHSWSIRSEFEQRLKMDAGQSKKKEDEAVAADLAQSQFILLLAFSNQAHSLELHELNEGVNLARENFGEKLGLSDDDMDEAMVSISRTLTASNVLDDSPEPLPWAWLLGAFAAWVPENTVMAATDANVISVWKDMELDFSLADATLGLPAGWLTVTAPAWKLAGKRRAPAGDYWIKELTAAFPAA